MIRAIALAAVLAAIAAAAVAMPGRPDSRPPRLAVARTTAPLAHSNSRDGRAILVADDLRPGDHRSGEVTIRNEGGAGGIALATRVSGRLAERLRLTVADSRTGAAAMQTALAGAPSCVPLGDLAAGESRTYRFTVSFDRGAGDQGYAGASARADFEWLDRCAPEPRPALALGDTRIAVDPGPYRFAGRSGTAKLGIRCLEAPAACAGRVELERRQPGRGRGIAMAVGRFRIRAGARRTITLKLNARARRRITSAHLVPVRAYVTATGADGRRHRAAYRDKLRYSHRPPGQSRRNSR